jgi:acetoin utilization deacetylase AcuC-like enzyme
VSTTETDRDDGATEVRLEVRSHPRCLEHRPGLGHPEQPGRLTTVLEALEPPSGARWRLVRDSPLPPEGDILGVLEWVHDAAHIERVRAAAGAGKGWLDSQDCVVSPGSFGAAVAAAGLALQAGLDLVNRRVDRVFVAARPPAHHAERSRARGYCFFNSVALAAEVIVRSWSRPVLVVDFDALHGNGTQQQFWERGDVGYLSVHRFPWFPGTGTADQIGAGPGLGLTRNVPLAEGADDEVFCTAFERGLAELATRLQPAALVVSAGFNAHHADPTGGMRLTGDGFRRLTRAVMAAARSFAGGRVLSFLEGGFAPAALAEGARAHVEEMADPDGSATNVRKAVN